MRSAHLKMVQETKVSLRQFLLKQRYFCVLCNYAGKADPGKDYMATILRLGVGGGGVVCLKFRVVAKKFVCRLAEKLSRLKNARSAFCRRHSRRRGRYGRGSPPPIRGVWGGLPRKC